MQRYWKWLILVAAVAVVVVAALSRPGSNKSPATTAGAPSEVKEGTQVGMRAPDFTVQTLDGKDVKLSSLRGKPVYINFWATWCPPCQKEMPDLQQVYEAGTPVQFMGIDATQTEKRPNAAQLFAESHHYTYPFYLDPKGNVQALYDVQGFPTSYFVDKDGIIRAIYLGPLTAEKLKARLQYAIDGKNAPTKDQGVSQ